MPERCLLLFCSAFARMAQRLGPDVTMRQLTKGFYVQFPRLQTAVPITLPENLVLPMPGFLSHVPVRVDSGIASGADLAIDVRVTLYLKGRRSYVGLT